MEPGFVTKIHFARYDRRELDTYYRASWIFGTVPDGNGSAFVLAFAFALYIPNIDTFIFIPKYAILIHIFLSRRFLWTSKLLEL